MPRADIGDLLSLQIPLPSLAEQKRIAAILNEQMGAVERARAAAESQLEAAKALPAAYLRAVFSSPEAKPWPQRRLGDVCGIIGGNTLPPPEECSADDRVYCLKVSDLDGPFSDGREVFGGSFYTSRTTAKNRILGPRSVIFPKRGGAIATNKKRTLKVFAVLDPNLMGVQAIPGSDLLPEFLHFWFQSWDLSALQSGNTVPQINQQDLSPLSVSVPDTPEQQRIAAMLSEQMDSAERARKAIEEELDAINKLPAALLRRAFNGGL
jgi:type I restriction enzyme S subunit